MIDKTKRNIDIKKYKNKVEFNKKYGIGYIS